VSIKSAFQAKRWNDAPVRRPGIDKLRSAIQGDYDRKIGLHNRHCSRPLGASGAVEPHAVTHTTALFL
jgi:hypothetical protein